MVKELELLQKEIKNKSMGIVAKEIGISKSTVSLLSREKYPNPQKMYQKIRDRYGLVQADEIIGISVSSVKELKDLLPILKEIG